MGALANASKICSNFSIKFRITTVHRSSINELISTPERVDAEFQQNFTLNRYKPH